MKRWKIAIGSMALGISMCAVADDAVFYDAVPASPQAREMTKFGDFPVSNYTGVPSISIPLYTITLKDISIPISISYNASGIKVAEESGRVGLGWSLDAGGVVTQTVHGRHQDFQESSYFNYIDATNHLEDLTGINHFDEYMFRGPWTSSPITIPQGMTHENLYIALSSDNYDTCGSTELSPDIFTYSFPGHSGRFIFSHSGEIIKESFDNISIEPDYIVDSLGLNHIAGWIITTPDGTKYTFAQTEKTTFLDRPSGESFNSAIYLTKIETVNHSVIEFKYTKDSSFLGSFTRNSGTGSTPAINKEYAYYENNRLSEITFPGGRLTFNYTSRTDLVTDKALESIAVYDVTDTLMHRWMFDYGYFQSNFTGTDNPTVSTLKEHLTHSEHYDSTYTTSHFTDDWNTTRLRLDALRRLSDSEEDNVYRFFYNEEILPTKLSTAQDHWGYFNGARNANLIPKYYVNESTQPETSLVNIVSKGGRADRNPNPEYGRSFLLDSIVYPTGGATKMRFEANRYKTDDLVYDPTRIRYLCSMQSDTAFVHFGESGAGDDWNKVLTFTVPTGTNFSTIDIVQEITLNSDYTDQSAELITSIIATDTGETLWHYRFDPINHTTETSKEYNLRDTLQIRPGSYKLVASGALHKYIQSAALSVSVDTPPSVFIAATPTSIGGGQRIAEMICYDSDGTQTGRKQFLYTTDGSSNETKTSGRLMEYPRYLKAWNTYGENGLRGSGYSVGYSSVTVMDYDAADNIIGKSVYDYVNIPDKYIEYSWSDNNISVTDESPTGVGAFEHSENGTLLKETYYKFNYGYTPVRTVEYIYSSCGDGPYIVWGILKSPLKAAERVTSPCYDEEMMEELWEQYGNDTYGYLNSKVPMGYLYPVIRPYWYGLTEKRVTQDGATTIYEYVYNGDFQMAVEKISSESRVYKTSKYSYPADFLSSASDSTIMARLIADNRIDAPIQTEETYDGDSYIVKYSYSMFDNVPRISAISTNTAVNGSLESRRTFSAYDKYGNVAYTRSGASLDCYLWSYEGQRLLAKTSGVNYPKLMTAIDTASINRIAEAKIPTSEQISRVSTLQSTLGNALVTRFTHHTLFGVTSVTDPAGMATGYDYDRRGRLKRKYFIDASAEQTLEEYLLRMDAGGDSYSRVRQFTAESGTTYLDHLKYYDGLGREVQRVDAALSPTGADIVTLTEYSSLDRVSRQWLPAAVPDNSGAKADISTIKQRAVSSNSDGYPYSVVTYEASALGRVESQMGAGIAWHSADKKQSSRRMTNDATEALRCIRYECTLNYTSYVLCKRKYYATGELAVTQTIEEDGQTGYIFVDPLGRTILERREEESGYSDTYYVYDNRGRLSLVIPPMASVQLAAQADSVNISSSHAAIEGYCYAYYYDERNRCIGKKLPGAEWIYYIHDRADRVIFTQSGTQRSRGEWSFAIPDRHGRTVIEGTCTNSLNVFQRQSATIYATRNKADNALKGYTVSAITLENLQLHRVTYYDDYSFMGHNSVPDSTATGFGCTSASRHVSAAGRETGRLTALLDEADTLTMLPSVSYYDLRGRLIQSTTANHLGGTDMTLYEYDFSGNVTRRYNQHIKYDQTTSTQEYTFMYDAAGRPTVTQHRFNNATSPTTLQTNTYDALGRLASRTEGGNTMTYTYNVRSWLKKMTSPLFTQTLYYEMRSDYSAGSYNGNISENSWALHMETSAGYKYDKSGGYKYSYDKLNRLINADFVGKTMVTTRPNKEPSNGMDLDFSTSYSYDLNGNIMSLKRKGSMGSAYRLTMDSISYNYSGNQLLKVSDDAIYPSNGNSNYFDDLADYNVEYTWDANGNMTMDANKAITAIEYNALNLPRRVTFADGHITEYLYDAAGGKRQTKYLVDNRTVFAAMTLGETESDEVMEASDSTAIETLLTRDYCGDYIYEDRELERISTANGYISPSGVYTFYISDYQGNIVNLTPSTRISNWSEYYPFGVHHSLTSSDRFLYSGKELDKINGLYLYDFHARHYDPMLARFTTIDPLCEKYYPISPYAYCAGNPIRYIDPTGMKIVYNMTNEEREKLMDHIGELKMNDLFSEIFSVLDKSINTYSISLGTTTTDSQGVSASGEFRPSANGGSIIFSNKKKPQDQTIVEEFYHAYQNEDDGMGDSNTNYEFEAKVFTAVVCVETRGHGSLNLGQLEREIDGYIYGDEFKPVIPSKVNSQFIDSYIDSGRSFVEYHRKNNSNKNHIVPVKKVPNRLINLLKAPLK